MMHGRRLCIFNLLANTCIAAWNCWLFRKFHCRIRLLQSDFTQVIIATTKTRNTFRTILQNLGRKKRIFCCLYKKPLSFSEQNNHNILLRAINPKCIAECQKGGEIIVTFPDALQELLVRKKADWKHLILKTSEKINVGFHAGLCW